MATELRSATLYGVEGVILRVEVDLLSLLPTFLIVGLPHSSVREARERVRSAIRAAGLPFPRRRITVNLAPADRPKQGTGLDLPIALGVVAAAWAAAEGLPAWDETPFALGELSLTGEVQGIRGVLPLVEAARRAELKRVIVPQDNLGEARLVPGIEIVGVKSLEEAWIVARGGKPSSSQDPPPPAVGSARGPDLSELRGLSWARRVIEVAAAGQHDLLLEGPPGSGKSMLARCLPSILPRLDEEAALEVMRIRSAAGLLKVGAGLDLQPPFRAPHHTSSATSIVGGGRPLRPGEATLAHHGVLLLDEIPEFSRTALEALRQPIQDGSILLARHNEVLQFPSRFQLIATRNPCPCGMRDADDTNCLCTPVQRDAYQGRISGPLLDRIGLVAWVDPVPISEIVSGQIGESSASVRERVTAARDLLTAASNGSVKRDLSIATSLSRLTPESRASLEDILTSVRCSTRAVKHVLAISLTVAALDHRDVVHSDDIHEALLLNNRLPGTTNPGFPSPSSPESPHV